MGHYISKRCLQAVFVLLGVTFVVYLILHLRGDPTDLLLPATASAEQEAIFREMGAGSALSCTVLAFFEKCGSW